jgi:hypothetical protein
MVDKAVPSSIKQSDSWCQMVTLFEATDEPNDEHVSVITIPPSIAHCCRLKVDVKRKRNQLHRIKKKQKKADLSSSQSNFATNDGLLHYAPYRVVITPSIRFFETLCVAEQGRKNDLDYQQPVYHSVIPNEVARNFDNQGIFPSGDSSDIIIGDFCMDVPVELPFNAYRTIQNWRVRRVLIKFSLDYKTHPKLGSCCLADKDYFRSCLRIFDEEWENEDIKNGIDVCLITGQPGPLDLGRNEILLSGRIYKQEFSIPLSQNVGKQALINDAFLSSCYEALSKTGYVTHRVGGSSGDYGATAEQLLYFKEHRGCFPNVAGAVLHLSMGSGKWRSYYISPYAKRKNKMVKTWQYSTPQIGGVFQWNAKQSSSFPHFFDRMSMVRSTMARVIIGMQQTNRYINISPRAIAAQERYNQLAKKHAKTKGCSEDVVEVREDRPLSFLHSMNQQVVYSFVGYTVGNHKDVTKTNVSKELIECKALLSWPSRSISVTEESTTALGRGGLGPGQFTVMIVDHPEK